MIANKKWEENNLLAGSGYIIIGLIAIFVLFCFYRAVMGYHKANISDQFINASAFCISKPDVESAIVGSAIEWPVWVEAAGKTIEATTKKISLFGAFVACPEPFDINEELTLNIKIEGREPIVIGAKVTWNNRHAEKTPKLVRGMGVNFIRISNGDRQFIKDEIIKNRVTESDDWFFAC